MRVRGGPQRFLEISERPVPTLNGSYWLFCNRYLPSFSYSFAPYLGKQVEVDSSCEHSSALSQVLRSTSLLQDKCESEVVIMIFAIWTNVSSPHGPF